MNHQYSSWEAFLQQSLEEVRAVAPKTVIYAVSGTRRAAVLAGVSPNGEAYAHWSRQQMVRCIQLLFEHGVKHTLMPLLTPSQFREVTADYQENLWRWVTWGLASKQALVDYLRLGWRVKIMFAHHHRVLMQIQTELLDKLDVPSSAPTLWVYVAPEHNILSQWALKDLAQRPEIQDTTAAITYLYGEPLPPATLYIDFGKLIVSPDLLPPFLAGKLHCYWNQEPGYSLTARSLRRILYDYAYTRQTWQADKSRRANKALEDIDTWQQEKIVGLGRRVGPYWYPDE